MDMGESESVVGERIKNSIQRILEKKTNMIANSGVAEQMLTKQSRKREGTWASKSRTGTRTEEARDTAVDDA